jgi:hypothetical protein
MLGFCRCRKELRLWRKPKLCYQRHPKPKGTAGREEGDVELSDMPDMIDIYRFLKAKKLRKRADIARELEAWLLEIEAYNQRQSRALPKPNPS